MPAGPGWLAALLGGFALADDVALVFGPHRPRADASPMVRRELLELFARFGGRAGRPRRRRRRAARRSSAAPTAPSPAGRGSAFRSGRSRYAEDQVLARDMLAAGLAKAYVPDAAVIHSHDLPPLQAFRRYFDDFRALAEVNGLREPLTPRYIAARVRGDVAADRAFMRREGLEVQTLRSLAHHVARALGRSLGTNADRLRRAR